MIYYLMFFVAGILIDLKDLKNSNSSLQMFAYLILGDVTDLSN